MRTTCEILANRLTFAWLVPFIFSIHLSLSSSIALHSLRHCSFSPFFPFPFFPFLTQSLSPFFLSLSSPFFPRLFLSTPFVSISLLSRLPHLSPLSIPSPSLSLYSCLLPQSLSSPFVPISLSLSWTRKNLMLSDYLTGWRSLFMHTHDIMSATGHASCDLIRPPCLSRRGKSTDYQQRHRVDIVFLSRLGGGAMEVKD